MYTSLFLDLDNTLLDFNAAEAHAVRKVLKSHGLPHDDAAVALYSDINRRQRSLSSGTVKARIFWAE